MSTEKERGLVLIDWTTPSCFYILRKEENMNQKTANQIRKLHLEGLSSKELCVKFRISKRVLYQVLDNQVLPQKGYEKKKTPKRVLDGFGQSKLLKLWDDKISLKDIQKRVEKETGVFINLGTLRWNIENWELLHAIACEESLS